MSVFGLVNKSLHCIGSLSLSPTPHPQPVIMEPLQGNKYSRLWWHCRWCHSADQILLSSPRLESHTPSLFLTKRWHRFRRPHRSCHSPYLMPRVHTQAHTYSRLVACRKTRANRLTLVASPFVYSSTLKHWFTVSAAFAVLLHVTVYNWLLLCNVAVLRDTAADEDACCCWSNHFTYRSPVLIQSLKLEHSSL
jgi:hypothetical protein